MIKSILAAVGEIAGGEDWAAARQHLSRELLERLMSMDPQAAWAEWQALCRWGGAGRGGAWEGPLWKGCGGREIPGQSREGEMWGW